MKEVKSMKNVRKSILFLLIAILLVGGALAGCSSKNDEAGADLGADFKIEETATAKQVAAYKAMITELNKAKDGKPVDWDVVLNEYQSNLQSAVTELNGEFDTAIAAGIAGAKSGELNSDVARQYVDKTTQSYFYQKQKALHSDVLKALEEEGKQKAKQVFAELQHLVDEVQKPTAAKRDEYYGVEMATQIETGLKLQGDALEAENAGDYKVYSQITDKTIYRSHYLAALSYAEKIEKAVKEGGAETVALQVKQAEGWGFIQAIIGSLSGGDEQAATKLNEIYSLNVTDPTTIASAEVSSLFTSAFLGKILSYHGKVPASLTDKDTVKARTQALEGNTFMKAIELVIIEKIGQEKTDELFANGEAWLKAVGEEKADEAAKISEKIVTTLNAVKL